MKFKFVILMSLTVLLSSSSFFLPDHIATLIESKQATTSQISYASKLGLPSALKFQLSSTRFGSRKWLYYATKLADKDGQFAIKLANFYHQQDDFHNALIWAKRAVSFNNDAARLYLGNYYFLHANYSLTKKVLLPITQQKEALALLIKVAIIQGDDVFISSHLKALEDFAVGRELLVAINKYQFFSSLLSTELNQEQYSNQKQCTANVQMFATSLQNLKKVDKLINDFKSHPLNLYFCFDNVRYIPRSKLNCTHQKEQAIRCDESIWSTIAQTSNTRYLGLMLPEGGANVNAGIMYLDVEDNVKVFAHELSHFLGFVDEYAVATEHKKCREEQLGIFSHNVSVIKSHYQGSREKVRAKVLKMLSWAEQIKPSTPILHKSATGWMVGTPDIFDHGNSLDNNIIGVFPSDTCNLHNTLAYKPLNQFTQLLYFESDFPDEYIRILDENSEKHLMPSYEYNIAKELLGKNKDTLAFTWLERALSREMEGTPRYKKIKRGVF